MVPHAVGAASINAHPGMRVPSRSLDAGRSYTLSLGSDCLTRPSVISRRGTISELLEQERLIRFKKPKSGFLLEAAYTTISGLNGLEPLRDFACQRCRRAVRNGPDHPGVVERQE